MKGHSLWVRVIICILVALMVLAMLIAPMLPALATSGTDLQSVRESVFRVVVYDETGNVVSLGSGFAIGKSSPVQYIVTNYHVVEPNPENCVIWLSTDQEVKCEVYTSMSSTDVAILKTENPIYREPLKLAKSDMVKAGDAVYAYGFTTSDISDFLTSNSTDVTITNGVVSKIAQRNGIGYYQTDASINSGNSGGPLYHKDGYVIGINTMKMEGAENIAGAVMIEEILDGLDNMGIAYTLVASAAQGGVTGGKLWLVLFVLGCAALCLVAGILLWQYFRPGKDSEPAPEGKAAMPLWEKLISLKNNKMGAEEESVPEAAERRRPILSCLSGPYAGTSLEMEGTVCIGREPRRCQLVYPTDMAEISRVHCVVRYEARSHRFVLEDHSSNGTYLMDGTRLNPNEPIVIHSGDRFYLADVGHLFEVKLEA